MSPSFYPPPGADDVPPDKVLHITSSPCPTAARPRPTGLFPCDPTA